MYCPLKLCGLRVQRTRDEPLCDRRGQHGNEADPHHHHQQSDDAAPIRVEVEITRRLEGLILRRLLDDHHRQDEPSRDQHRNLKPTLHPSRPILAHTETFDAQSAYPSRQAPPRDHTGTTPAQHSAAYTACTTVEKCGFPHGCEGLAVPDGIDPHQNRGPCQAGSAHRGTWVVRDESPSQSQTLSRGGRPSYVAMRSRVDSSCPGRTRVGSLLASSSLAPGTGTEKIRGDKRLRYATNGPNRGS